MIAKAQADDDNAKLVAGLFDDYAAAIFAYVWHLVCDRDLAEELLQETFLRVFEARDRLSDVINRRAWVYRVATNTCYSALRRRNRFTWLPWHSAPDRIYPDAAEGLGRQTMVESALGALSPDYRAPLLLFLHEGFSIAEISDALGISEGAVKTRIYRAREMFRRAYAEETRDEHTY